jgi:hypothetical protein
MRQSRLMSLVEAVANVVIGLIVAVATQIERRRRRVSRSADRRAPEHPAKPSTAGQKRHDAHEVEDQVAGQVATALIVNAGRRPARLAASANRSHWIAPGSSGMARA